jgi:triacylglycerol lipase
MAESKNPTGPGNGRSELRRAVAQLGSALSAEGYARTKALFAPLQTAPAAADLNIERDIAYGAHPLQTVDVYSPTAAGQPRSVVVFVHGGGFVGGDKHEDGGPFYDNVGIWAVTQGFVGVLINYRLAPHSTWPGGSEDVSAAVNWVGEHIHRFGGDPERVVLMGHSAGAAHAAGCLAVPADGRHSRHAIAAFIGVSGIYDLGIAPVNTAYFGADETLYPSRSPLPGILRSSIPLCFAIAEYDPPLVAKHFVSVLSGRLAAGEKLPYIVQVPGHNHFSAILHLNTHEVDFGAALSGFIERTFTGLSRACEQQG